LDVRVPVDAGAGRAIALDITFRGTCVSRFFAKDAKDDPWPWRGDDDARRPRDLDLGVVTPFSGSFWSLIEVKCQMSKTELQTVRGALRSDGKPSDRFGSVTCTDFSAISVMSMFLCFREKNALKLVAAITGMNRSFGET
jgi:hypothetical protein